MHRKIPPSIKPKRPHMLLILCAGCGANTNDFPIRHNPHCPRQNGDHTPVERFMRTRLVANLPKLGEEKVWKEI